MPNTGRPSRDCHLCRERRVKCDLEQPGCRRCAIAGRICPGYRDELDMLFQQSESIESYPASSARDRRYRNRIEQTVSRDAERALQRSRTNELSGQHAPGPQSAVAAQLPPMILRNLTESWDEHIVPLVVNQLSPSSGPRRLLGVVDFFPGVLENTHQHDVLMLSSKALLFAYLGNKYNDTELQRKKIVAYGQAITATSNALRDATCSTQDEVVFSIFLMGMYELLNGSHATQHQPGPADWVRHTRGLIELFRLRGREQFTTQRGCDIFRLLNDNIQTLVLAAGLPCPAETLEWMQAIETHVSAADLDAHHRAMQSYHAAAICATVNHALKTKSPISIAPVLEQIDRLDIVLAAITTRKSFAETMRLGMGYNRNYSNTVRMKMQACVLELTNSRIGQESLAAANTDDLRHHESSSMSLTQALADEILATIPYLLSPDSKQPSSMSTNEALEGAPRPWIECIRLLWPLRTIAGSAFVRPDQMKAATAALSRISSEYHVRFALEPLWISVEQLRRRQAHGFQYGPAGAPSLST